MITLKAFKYRIYPTKQQLILLNKTFGCVRVVWNHNVEIFDIIAIEDLNVAGMIKNHKLAKSISDASFSEFYNILSYKAKWYGKEVIKIERWFASSKTCSCCGWKNEHLTLSDRTFICKACGFEINRDSNASKNILKEALRVSNALRTPSGCQTLAA
jgi:putative transposase